MDIPEPSDECPMVHLVCTNLLDVLIVVDNSRSMAEEQRTLARSIPQLVDMLSGPRNENATRAEVDVHVMVTTMDVGNPACPERPEYEPALGAPITTACINRLEDFTDASGSLSVPELCEDVCPQAVEPDGPYVSFGPSGTNVPDVDPLDIDQDGRPDPPEAQALACIGLPGINGCSYSSPIDAMLRALDPDAPHNLGDRPFVREGAALVIIFVTDKADCSITDPALARDASVWNIDPQTGVAAPSPALCWNAGAQCDGPDAEGVYSDCRDSDDPRMLSTTDTAALLRERWDYPESSWEHRVVMLQLAGVPPVESHNPNLPFNPFEGGESDLVYRQWIDGPYPMGDIVPDDVAAGLDAADKQFERGIGPGCTADNGPDPSVRQGTAPARMLELCHGLDLETTSEPDDYSGLRCCVESVCDDDFSGAYLCLEGMLALMISYQHLE